MSEPENFVARWSRLKRQSDKTTADEDAKPTGQPETEAAPPAADRAVAARETPTGGPPPAFDPASLPSIEAIAESTDIRAFLQSGVPAELTKAALRRAWSADPAIRDFIGLAENQWDFTDPTAIAGFGPLEATEEVRKLIAQATGKVGETVKQAAAEYRPPDCSVRRSTAGPDRSRSASHLEELGMPDENPRETTPVAAAGEEQSRVDVAARDDDRPAKGPAKGSRRGHGSALPQ